MDEIKKNIEILENETKRDIEILADELKRDKLVIFVGAGISRNSGLPTWDDLIKKFNIEDKENNKEEYLKIPQEYYNKYGKVQYYRVLERVFEGNYEPNKIHEKIKELKPNYIVTTNYDTLLEDKLNEEVNRKEHYDVIVKDQDLAYSNSNKMIIKMHGDLSEKNVVLKQDDYDNYEKERPLLTSFLKGLFTTNTVIFMGFSFDDINLKNIFKWLEDILKEDFRKAYLVDTSSDPYKDETNNTVRRIFLRNEKRKMKLI